MEKYKRMIGGGQTRHSLDLYLISNECIRTAY